MCIRTYGGKEANIESSAGRQVILATVMKGLLQHTRECKTVPSLINAPFLSQELGIETVIDDKVCVEGVFKAGEESRWINCPIETPWQTLTNAVSLSHRENIARAEFLWFLRETSTKTSKTARGHLDDSTAGDTFSQPYLYA